MHDALRLPARFLRQEPDILSQRRESLAELDDLVQLIAEIFESRYGNNDGVTATINFLGDPQETAPRVLSQVKREVFPFNSDIMIL
jgi:hypothetical protein